jgi:transposase InsO family protein
VKFALVDAEKAYPIAGMCSLLGVSRSGFYAWRKRPPSAHALEDQRLRVLVREAHVLGRCYYGSPRVHFELAENGTHVSRKRVVRLMQEQHLVARKRRRYKCTTMSDHDQPIAPNLLQRQFYAQTPNQCWVGDTTELLIGPNGREAVSRGDPRSVLALRRRLVALGGERSAPHDQGARHGTSPSLSWRRPLAPLRPRLDVRE